VSFSNVGRGSLINPRTVFASNGDTKNPNVVWVTRKSADKHGVAVPYRYWSLSRWVREYEVTGGALNFIETLKGKRLSLVALAKELDKCLRPMNSV
jgi:hypothetical protein